MKIMKYQLNKISFILMFLCLSALTSTAQRNNEGSEFTNVLKTNVLGYFVGQYQLAYERALSPNFSAQLSAGFLTGKSNGSLGGNSYNSKRTGFIVIPEARYYFSGHAPKRMYIGAFLRYRSADNELTDNSWTTGGTGTNQDLSRERKVSSIGGGLILGYQVITRGGFTFDVFAGPQYKDRSTKITYNTSALNDASTNSEYDSKGDALFDSKFLNFKIADNANFGLRFGFNVGYAF